jgi:hypothetical protein
MPCQVRRAGQAGGKLEWGRQCQRARNRFDYSPPGWGVDKLARSAGTPRSLAAGEANGLWCRQTGISHDLIGACLEKSGACHHLLRRNWVPVTIY